MIGDIMPEEMTNNAAESKETAQTSATTAETKADATTIAKQEEKAPETTVTKESAEKAEPTKQEEPAKKEQSDAEEYTIDSYKDLLDQQMIEEFDLTDGNLAEFKELGVKNHIPPATLKAIAAWSLENVRKQNEHIEKVHEEWRKQNEEKYGENLKNVKTNVGRVLADMDKTGQFASLLKNVGAEEHPATLAFLSAIGDVLLEKGSVNPNATIQGKEMSLEDMYRNNK